MSRSIKPEHFDHLYAASSDPWNFTGSAYEQAKYRDTLDQLRPGYRQGLELGCSIGVLSGWLATRCERLLGIDCSQAAIERARARHADNPRLRFERMVLPGDFPMGRHDLIVLSELLYFFDAADLTRLAARTLAAATPAADIILVNWLGETDTALSGDAAAELFVAALAEAAPRSAASRREHYRIDLLRRRAG